ncbi:MAG: hypothetical protein K8T91_00025 [Planctomycetes bacterium]|nr:hypothetical protein [Planctomycetota bacterium]
MPSLRSLAVPSLLTLLLLAATAQLARAEEPAKPDPNPPSEAKVAKLKWPGLVSIFHGDAWGSDEKYLQAIAECGFGATGCSEKEIDQCRKYGMKAYIFCWPHEAAIIPAKHKDDDAVLCYFYSDRQKPKKWGLFAEWEKQSYQADPYHPAVFTMASDFGYMDMFVPIVHPRLLEYYHYHWDGKRQPHMHFANLETLRQSAAKAGGIPICRIVETRAEDKRKTRQTVYTSLAYGVRGYRGGGRGLFDRAKLDDRGLPTRTEHGEEALRLNQAIKSYSPVFEKARSVDVFHTAPLPPGTKEAPADHWVRPTGEEIVLGEFADPDKNRFLVVANRDAGKPHEATIHIAEADLSVERMDKVTGKWQPVTGSVDGKKIAVKVPLEEGSGELLRVVPAK